MILSSFHFIVLFTIVFILNYFLKHKWQNRMLLLASYVFYSFWDWKFLLLLLLPTFIDYLCALKIHDTDKIKVKRGFLAISITTNLIILGFFKYFNFFTSSFLGMFTYFGIALDPFIINIILPIGISFYTFRTMSYTIDVFRGELEPVHNLFDYALYVSFFPLLLAGPIEKAKRLIPQIIQPRILTTENLFEGTHLIFWGFFLKAVIADNLAKVVDPVFSAGGPYNGFEVMIATYAFSIQLFCDFEGYTCIARGFSKYLGFNIMLNFNLPYFASDPQDFWRRWHISLSQWFRDYIYIPLGGNRRGKIWTILNINIVMILVGLWHGANWTFIIWGFYHGILLSIHRVFKFLNIKIQPIRAILIRKLGFIIQVFVLFQFICAGWLLFRANSIGQAIVMYKSLFINFNLSSMNFKADIPHTIAISIIPIIIFVFIIQIFQYRTNNLLYLTKMPIWLKILVYCGMTYLIMTIGVTYGQEFIYLQF